jgi:hypothetical protein
MRSIFKNVLVTITGVAIVLTGVNSANAASYVQKYYKNNQVSLEKLEKKWGTPVNVKEISEGIEKRVYGTKDSEIGYNYFLLKDGLVIDRGVTQLSQKQMKKLTSPKMSRLVSSYFKRNKRTVQDMIKKYGEPVSKKIYPNGMERVVFGPSDSEVGFRYYVTLNGRILDGGLTSYNSKIAEDKDAPKVSQFMTKWYKKHPKSVVYITKKWGQPISVKEYKNGMKKMVFGPKDAVMGYNFFITKDGKVIDRGITDSNS